MAESGGHAHGTLMGAPLAPLTAPSQFPAPSGFLPAVAPRLGISAGSTPPVAGAGAGAAGAGAGAGEGAGAGAGAGAAFPARAEAS